MKKFIKYLSTVLIASIILLVFLDYNYTLILENSTPRTKFQFFKSLENKKIDCIFLGSSRVENDIVPSVIEKVTKKKVVNLGFQASRLADIYTNLQLIKKYNITTEKVFIQIDYIFNSEGHSNIMEYEIMPFIRDNQVTKQYCENYIKEPKMIYYFPFYRYCKNDLKIGSREIFANLIGKKTTVVETKGYGSLNSSNYTDTNYALPATIKDRNDVFYKIKLFAKNNKIKLVFFCAPFYKDCKNIDFIQKLKLKIPDLYDFSSAVTEKSMFNNSSHLNDKGARYFSLLIADSIMNDKTLQDE